MSKRAKLQPRRPAEGYEPLPALSWSTIGMDIWRAVMPYMSCMDMCCMESVLRAVRWGMRKSPWCNIDWYHAHVRDQKPLMDALGFEFSDGFGVHKGAYLQRASQQHKHYLHCVYASTWIMQPCPVRRGQLGLYTMTRNGRVPCPIPHCRTIGCYPHLVAIGEPIVMYHASLIWTMSRNIHQQKRQILIELIPRLVRSVTKIEINIDQVRRAIAQVPWLRQMVRCSDVSAQENDWLQWDYETSRMWDAFTVPCVLEDGKHVTALCARAVTSGTVTHVGIPMGDIFKSATPLQKKEMPQPAEQIFAGLP